MIFAADKINPTAVDFAPTAIAFEWNAIAFKQTAIAFEWNAIANEQTATASDADARARRPSPAFKTPHLFFVSRTIGDADRVNNTTSSPVIVLMSW